MKEFFTTLVFSGVLSVVFASPIYEYREHQLECPPGSTNELLKHPRDCFKYLQCDHGTTHIRDCGPGTAFNPEHHVCDWPYNVPGCSNGHVVEDHDHTRTIYIDKTAGTRRYNMGSGQVLEVNTIEVDDHELHGGAYGTGGIIGKENVAGGFGVKTEDGHIHTKEVYGRDEYSKGSHSQHGYSEEAYGAQGNIGRENAAGHVEKTDNKLHTYVDETAGRREYNVEPGHVIQINTLEDNQGLYGGPYGSGGNIGTENLSGGYGSGFIKESNFHQGYSGGNYGTGRNIEGEHVEGYGKKIESTQTEIKEVHGGSGYNEVVYSKESHFQEIKKSEEHSESVFGHEQEGVDAEKATEILEEILDTQNQDDQLLKEVVNNAQGHEGTENSEIDYYRPEYTGAGVLDIRSDESNHKSGSEETHYQESHYSSIGEVEGPIY